MQGHAVSRAELAIMHAEKRTSKNTCSTFRLTAYLQSEFFYSFQIHEFVNNNDDGNGVNTDYTGRHGWLGSRVVSVLDSGAEGPGLRQTVHTHCASVHKAAKLVAALLRVAGVTAAYRRVYDSRHLQADCQEPGSSPEPYARQSSMGYLYLFTGRHTLAQVYKP